MKDDLVLICPTSTRQAADFYKEREKEANHNYAGPNY